MTRANRFDSIGSEGEMEYLDSSGLWVYVGGTKATGKVPTIQSDGTVEWETPPSSGGGGTPTAPSDQTNMLAWYKADAGVYSDAGVTLATDGQTVQRWADQSGNGNHANQATSGNRPRYNTTSVRGGPSLWFDNSDDFLTSVTVSAPYTIFAVFSSLGANADRRALSGSNNWLIGIRSGLWSHFAVSAFIASTSAAATRGYFGVTCARNSSTKSQFYVEGVDVSEATAAVGAPGTLYIGCAGAVTNEPLNGYIQEVVVFNASLTDARVEDWNAYLRGTYLP